jgi:hypothetical protein
LLPLRQPILYAEVLWRRQRYLAGLLLIIGLVSTSVLLINPKMREAWGQQNFLIFLAYIPAGVLFLGALFYNRWRSYVKVTDDGLKISNLLHSVTIAWEDVRGARVQPLERHFQEGKRRVPPAARDLAGEPALFVRLRADEDRVKEIRRLLGTNLTYEDTIAVPVHDPDALSWQITSRIPERVSSNLGGKRRGKRTR